MAKTIKIRGVKENKNTGAVRVEYLYTFPDGSTEESDINIPDFPTIDEIKDQLKFHYRTRVKIRARPKQDYKKLLKNVEEITVE